MTDDVLKTAKPEVMLELLKDNDAISNFLLQFIFYPNLHELILRLKLQTMHKSNWPSYLTSVSSWKVKRQYSKTHGNTIKFSDFITIWETMSQNLKYATISI